MGFLYNYFVGRVTDLSGEPGSGAHRGPLHGGGHRLVRLSGESPEVQ
jgi:hypothetical protein